MDYIIKMLKKRVNGLNQLKMNRSKIKFCILENIKTAQKMENEIFVSF
ncbi:unnamed protein product [Paramecium sonneborni]|uniref:Uncharacterized protein n=1 Tax=Paramecium sonneborni TaxID=65129 RepID=A0A8S1RS16_9CILI|nr:unnamed protein product [Paramecium sonneborni]